MEQLAVLQDSKNDICSLRKFVSTQFRGNKNVAMNQIILNSNFVSHQIQRLAVVK